MMYFGDNGQTILGSASSEKPTIRVGQSHAIPRFALTYLEFDVYCCLNISNTCQKSIEKQNAVA